MSQIVSFSHALPVSVLAEEINLLSKKKDDISENYVSKIVPISSLRVDRAESDELNATLISELAEAWNDTVIHPIIVSERAGLFYILSGVRWALAAMLHGKDMVSVYVSANGDTTFTRASNDVRPITRFKSAVVSNEHPLHDVAVGLLEICESLGVKIAEHNSPGVLTGVDRLMVSMEKYDSTAVYRALKLYTEIWPQDRIHAYLTSGMIAWIWTFRDVKFFTDSKIINALRQDYQKHTDIVNMCRHIRNRKNTDYVYARILTLSYNKHTTGRGTLDVSLVDKLSTRKL